MPFDQSTRNRLARFVGNTRALLTEEFTRQLQLEYGLDPETGAVADLATLTHLDDARRETARILRNTLAHYLAGQPQPANRARLDAARRDILDRIVREQAYTVLNRLCALRMAEARGLLIESVARGYQSKGFQLYARLAGPALGETGDAYRSYLFSLFDEFAVDLAVLFDRFSPQGRLFPRETALLRLLDEINHPDLTALWTEDETIGWIYQYFNSDEERRQMRAESQAPRNSRELAVRNQFFTPRYVVEFLTDNTLGRIWYEMTQGQTSLKETCRYLVRRPNEVFLKEGEVVSDQSSVVSEEEELSQEELLRLPVYIPYRPRKDPREIKMLDPACGSMHFGLYAFDLFERIYAEAWDLQASGQWAVISDQQDKTDHRPLTTDYSSKAAFLRDVPRLIIEHNIHGVDIDPRAVQIAGLSLWLRAQKSWQTQGLKPQERPQIRRSNIVCAEPMPGDRALLAEFTATLPHKVIGQLVEIVFDKMALAGEAGSLLKIEEELAEAVETARQAYNEQQLQEKQVAGYLPGFKLERPATLFDFADLPTDADSFWTEAESQVLAALQAYAAQAQNGSGYQRRLFAEDAARGFAFIDVCRKQYDVVVMNPPFGDAARSSKDYLWLSFPNVKYDLYAMFVSRWLDRLYDFGSLGAITNKTGFFLQTLEAWRRQISAPPNVLTTALDFGFGVLDRAVVETMCYTIQRSVVITRGTSMFVRLTDEIDKRLGMENSIEAVRNGNISNSVWFRDTDQFKIIPYSPMCYWAGKEFINLFRNCRSFAPTFGHIYQGIATGDNFRFLRCHWEVPMRDYKEGNWITYAKGGTSTPWYSDFPLVVFWKNNGWEMKANAQKCYGSSSRTIKNEEVFFQPGLTYTQVTVKGLFVRALPARCIFDMKGPSILINDGDLYTALAVFCSLPIRALAKLITDCRQWHPTNIMNLPYPNIKKDSAEKLRYVVQQLVGISQLSFSYDETSGLFLSYTEEKFSLSMTENQSARLIDEIIAQSFGVQVSEFIELDGFLQASDDTIVEDDIETADSFNTKADLVSYLLGCIYGRWNVQSRVDKNTASYLPDPFASLPTCPPGMLQNAQGLPAAPEDVAADYPLRVSWPGILVDDPGHPEDIEGRVREALRVIWQDRADAIEQEACQILGVDSLRAYFANPNRFFDDHLKRYSKSRRAAPIYWPLSTPSGSYTLWLYYHRLTDQTLYSCVNDFVDVKLPVVSVQCSVLRQKSGRSSQEEKELEQLTDFEQELQTFRDELLRLAAIWKPNLNDGVQITAAPLWRLFQHRGWQKRLRETWEQLEAGAYDWAHLALSLWPERVVPACVEDRSFAIAHDLEDLFWVEDAGSWRTFREPEEEIAAQKRRQQLPTREHLRDLLADLAAGEAKGVPAYQVCQHLVEGDWDDLSIAAMLWPERVAEKCWELPMLSQQLAVHVPNRRSESGHKRVVKQLVEAGCPDLADAFALAFKDAEAPFDDVWAALAQGDRDHEPLALALWPGRVIDKCVADADLAALHNLRHYFWYQRFDGRWQRRQTLRREIADEVGRRK